MQYECTNGKNKLLQARDLENRGKHEDFVLFQGHRQLDVSMAEISYSR